MEIILLDEESNYNFNEDVGAGSGEGVGVMDPSHYHIRIVL